jgi:hypothetical protein
MTHDELVSAIKKGIVMTGNRLASHEEGANLYRRTVLAVVELHQSAPFKMTGNVEEIPGLLCLHCSTNLEPKDWIHYPCPTIQAIEKELA